VNGGESAVAPTLVCGSLEAGSWPRTLGRETEVATEENDVSEKSLNFRRVRGEDPEEEKVAAHVCCLRCIGGIIVSPGT